MADVQHFAGVVTPIDTTTTKCGLHVSFGSAPSTPDPLGIWWDKDDDCLKVTDDGGVTYTFRSPSKRSITIHIDGIGAPPSIGIKGRWIAPCACTIVGWTLLADQSGAAVIDVKHSTYAGFPTTASIAGTDKPTLATAQKNTNQTLSAWTLVAIAQNDVLEFNLDSVTTCEMLDLTLNINVG